MNVETKRALEDLADEEEADRMLDQMAHDEYYDHIENEVWFWYESGGTSSLRLTLQGAPTYQ